VRRAGPLAIDHFMKIVWRRDISRFHSYLVRASKRAARPYFACERSVGVLVVFELDHRLILLEPFHIMHKGNFARSPSFHLHDRSNVNVGQRDVAVQHVRCGSPFAAVGPAGSLCFLEGFLIAFYGLPLMAPSPGPASIAGVCSSSRNVELHAVKRPSNAAR
jgi:hypothetical protein